MVMDNLKEELFGKFRHKCRQAGLHVKQTKPYTLWSNAMEGAIREVKQGAGCRWFALMPQNNYGMIVSKERP
jgi:hypothetical protein